MRGVFRTRLMKYCMGIPKSIFRTTFLLSFFLLSAAATAHDNKDVEHALQQLDDALMRRQEYINQKQMALKAQKRALAELNDPNIRLIKYEQLFTDYLHFNGDSAVFYAQKAVETAQKLNDRKAIVQAQIYLLTALTRKGIYTLADKLSLQIGNVADVPEVLQSQYACCLIDQSLRIKRLAMPLDSLLFSAKKSWDDYSPYIDKNDWQYHFYQGSLLHKGDLARVKQMLSEAPHPSFVAADLAYTLAVLYQEQGNDTEYEYYLIQSAINDVKLANTEVQSLVSLVQVLSSKCDMDRLYRYSQVCSENITTYRDLTRAMDVVCLLNQINTRFYTSLQHRMTATSVIAGLLAVALVLVFFSLRYSIRRRKALKQSLLRLEEAQKSQERLIESKEQLSHELHVANQQLRGSLKSYNTNFVNVYRLVASYMSYENKMRKSLSAQIKSGNVQQALRSLNSSSEIDEQTKEFYQHFDHAFLGMYSDYVQKMNALLKPEYRVDPEAPGLTNSFRIYALVVLGVTDSVSIAEFLHYSPQTIYNYRLRMRRQACVPEKEFESRVEYLYTDDAQ